MKVSLLVILCFEALVVFGQPDWDSINSRGLRAYQNERYDSALIFFEQGKGIAEADKLNANYATAVGNLGSLLVKLGRYEEAESNLLEAAALNRKLFGDKHPSYAISCTHLGIFYRSIGNYAEAERSYLIALPIIEQYYSKVHPRYADAASSLAALYIYQDKPERSEKLLYESLGIRNMLSDKSPEKYAKALSDVGSFYLERDQFERSRYLFQQSLAILDSTGESIQRADVLFNYGKVEMLMNHLPEAETFFLQSLSVQRKKLSGDHPGITTTQYALSKLYRQMGDAKKTEVALLESVRGVQSQVTRYFPFLSDLEKEQYYKTVRETMDAFNSYCVQHPQPHLLQVMFNNQLETKGLLLNSSIKWKQRIKNSADKKLFTQFLKWESMQVTLANAIKQGNITDVDSLSRNIQQVEKDLIRRSEAFANLTDNKTRKWEEIRDLLKPNEVAIEIIRVPKWGHRVAAIDSSTAQMMYRFSVMYKGDKVVYEVTPTELNDRGNVKTYQQVGLTDTVQYIALMIHARSKSPEAVMLLTDNSSESKHHSYYRNAIIAKIKDTLTYRALWKPIADHVKKLKLPKGKTPVIYLSADGIYHQVNLNTLVNPTTGKYLEEEVELRLITNTKELLTSVQPEVYNNLGYLFGSPDFSAMSALAPLPGTKLEVESIYKLLKSNSWKPELLTGSDATEAKLKDCFKPRLLHIATHGYFQRSDGTSTQKLYESGLFLTPDDDDGILTPYEAMNLNLDNTELVVLSACETGLGNVEAGEGVYGLQRAFKVAGAQNIVMSLWKVDDAVTQEFMIEFYRRWLALQDKHAAFVEARGEIRKKYPDESLWGSFVLLGK